MASLNDLLERLWRGLHIPQRDALGLFSRATPAIMLDDLTVPPGTDPTVIRPFMGHIQVAAAAGDVCGSQIINPVGSGKLVIVERLYTKPGTDDVVLGLAGALAAIGGTYNDTGTTAYRQPRDLRSVTNPAAQLHGTNDSGDQIQASAASFIVIVDANTNICPIELNIVLEAGQGFAWENNSVNNSARSTVWGREIPDLSAL